MTINYLFIESCAFDRMSETDEIEFAQVLDIERELVYAHFLDTFRNTKPLCRAVLVVARARSLAAEEMDANYNWSNLIIKLLSLAGSSKNKARGYPVDEKFHTYFYQSLTKLGHVTKLSFDVAPKLAKNHQVPDEYQLEAMLMCIYMKILFN